MEEDKLFLKKIPKDGKIDRVHAILLTDDGRVLLRYKNGEARITGGHIDASDTDLESALRREVLEELNCEIDKCDYLGYLEVKVPIDDAEAGDAKCVEGGIDDLKFVKENWARMVARVIKILPPKADPDRDGNWIYGRTLAPVEIAKEEMGEIPRFGMNNLKLIDYALKVAQEKSYFTQLPNDEYEVLNVETHDLDKTINNFEE